MQHLSNPLIQHLLAAKYNPSFALLVKTLQKPYTLYDLLKEFKIQKKHYHNQNLYETLLNLPKLKFYLILAIKHSYVDINQQNELKLNFYAVIAELFTPQIYQSFDHDPKLLSIFDYAKRHGTFTYSTLHNHLSADLLNQFKYLIHHRFIVYADYNPVQIDANQQEAVWTMPDKKQKKNKKANQKQNQAIKQQIDVEQETSKLEALVKNLDTNEYYTFKFNYKAILNQLTR